MDGCIALQRQILDWEWWSDSKTTRLWITILLLANYEDKKWKGIDIKRGQFVTSISSLSKYSGLSAQSVRTSLQHLESTGEITRTTTKKYTLITVEKYNTYQFVPKQTNKENNTEANSQLTNNQQTTNKQLTTTNKDNKLNKDNNYYHMAEQEVEIGEQYVDPVTGRLRMRVR